MNSHYIYNHIFIISVAYTDTTISLSFMIFTSSTLIGVRFTSLEYFYSEFILPWFLQFCMVRGYWADTLLWMNPAIADANL